MTIGQKLIPTKINLDIADGKMPPDTARFLKGLTLYITSNNQKLKEGQNEGVAKPFQSNQVYYNLILPEGENYQIGSFTSKETSEVFQWYWNSLGNHWIARINGASQTIDKVINPYFNFQYKPEYFIAEGGCDVQVVYIQDPVTNQ